MALTVPLFSDLSLTLSSEPDGNSGYPTAPLQKGWLLRYGEQNLAEEAVGFGLPVLKMGLKALFPGTVDLEVLQGGPLWKIRTEYTLNLVERILRHKTSVLEKPAFYAFKDSSAALLRRIPALRGPLTALSSAARRTFCWETTYEPASLNARVTLLYGIDSRTGSLQIRLEPESLKLPPATELILMDEQGARFFDRYEEPSEVYLQGEAIGCWDEVHAARAGFFSSGQRIRFTVPQVSRTRLYRGRELVGSRLAWAGFGHVLPAPFKTLEYTLQLEKVS